MPAGARVLRTYPGVSGSDSLFQCDYGPQRGYADLDRSASQVQNEAQLATVIGHEFGHYLRRHSLQMMRDLIDKTSALVFVQLATAVAGIPAAGDIMGLIAIGSIMGSTTKICKSLTFAKRQES